MRAPAKPLLTLIILGALCGSTRAALADQVDWAEAFKDKDGCFLLFDLKADKTAAVYGKKRCAEPVLACSTFKIPVALMAFDSGILKDTGTVIPWDHIDRKSKLWNQNQTPKTWLKYSTVWVTQRMTQKLKDKKVKKYLADFAYGNQDMSGGLTQAWLSSGPTLKISADEQVTFLKHLWRGELAVSTQAAADVQQSLDSATSPTGWVLQGKTGSGFLDGRTRPGGRELGWYVGHLARGDAEYLVVTNFDDKEKPTEKKPGGERAKSIAEQVLGRMGLY